MVLVGTHGVADLLVFEDETGGKLLMTHDQVLQALRGKHQVGKQAKCVFLSACYSEECAKHLGEEFGVDHVLAIGKEERVRHLVSRVFFKELLVQVMGGNSVQRGFECGRQSAATLKELDVESQNRQNSKFRYFAQNPTARVFSIEELEEIGEPRDLTPDCIVRGIDIDLQTRRFCSLREDVLKSVARDLVLKEHCVLLINQDQPGMGSSVLLLQLCAFLSQRGGGTFKSVEFFTSYADANRWFVGCSNNDKFDFSFQTASKEHGIPIAFGTLIVVDPSWIPSKQTPKSNGNQKRQDDDNKKECTAFWDIVSRQKVSENSESVQNIEDGRGDDESVSPRDKNSNALRQPIYILAVNKTYTQESSSANCLPWLIKQTNVVAQFNLDPLKPQDVEKLASPYGAFAKSSSIFNETNTACLVKTLKLAWTASSEAVTRVANWETNQDQEASGKELDELISYCIYLDFWIPRLRRGLDKEELVYLHKLRFAKKQTWIEFWNAWLKPVLNILSVLEPYWTFNVLTGFISKQDCERACLNPKQANAGNFMFRFSESQPDHLVLSAAILAPTGGLTVQHVLLSVASDGKITTATKAEGNLTFVNLSTFVHEMSHLSRLVSRDEQVVSKSKYEVLRVVPNDS